MGHHGKNLKRLLLALFGLKYSDKEWEEVYYTGKGFGVDGPNRATAISFSQAIGSPLVIETSESDTSDIPYFKKSAVEYFLKSNIDGLKFEQVFKQSKKHVRITILSKLKSGTLDQKILNDPEAEGFLYFLNLPKISSKPMYISIPEVAVKLLSGEWIETTGAIKNLL